MMRKFACLLFFAFMRFIKGDMFGPIQRVRIFDSSKGHHQAADQALYDYRVSDRKKDSLQLVREPMVITGDMTLKYSSHFYRGCAYTISMWVFLYRPADSHYERVLFSTTPLTGTPGSTVDPIEDEASNLPPAMLPFVLTGVGTGDDKDRMFVGITRDAQGMYHGFWARSGSPVVYEEWMHISITVDENSFLKVYQNGELVGHSALEYQTGPMESLCPYNYLTKESEVAPFADLTEYANNTAFYILNSHNNLVSSTAGLVQQASIFRNAAVPSQMVKRIIRSTRPPGVDFLVHLLRSYGHYSYNQFCPLEWMTHSHSQHHSSSPASRAKAWARGSFYPELEWKLCPQAVCGPVSLDPQWVLGVPTREVYFYYGGANDAAMDEGVAHESNAEIPARDGLPAIRANGMRRKRRYSFNAALHCGGVDRQREDDGRYGAPSDDPSSEPSIGRYLLELASRVTSKITHSIPAHASRIFKALWWSSSDTASGTCANDATPQTLKRLRYTSGHPTEVKASDRDPRVSWTDPLERKRRRRQRAVHDLYHCGMLWLHGSYYDRAAPMSSTLRYDPELCHWLVEPFLVYSHDHDDETLYPRMGRLRAKEMAVSAFALAAWLADELHREYPDTARRLPWPFRSSALLTQPLHQALASHYGWDRSEQVRLPDDLGLLLQNHLTEPKNVVEYYTKVVDPPPPGPFVGSRRDEQCEPLEKVQKQLGELVLHVYMTIPKRVSSHIPKLPVRVSGDSAMMMYVQLCLIDDMEPYEGGVRMRAGTLDLDSFHLMPWMAVADEVLESAGVPPDTDGATQYPFGDSPIVDRDVLARLLLEGTETPIVGRFSLEQTIRREEHDWELFSRDENRKDYSRRRDRHIDTAKGVTEKDSLQYSRSVAKTPSALGRETTIDMHAAAAHLFPVAQYAAANYGAEGSGVAYVEEIFVSRPEEFWLRTGAEDNPVIQYDEAQANAGDVEAQLVVARQYYWGSQGLEPQPAVAAQWYERAAREHNNPEALYNLGVLHANGQGGYRRDMARALEYFERAADPQDGQAPFDMAVYAMASHFLHTTREFSKAVEYLKRACHLGSADAHYTLGTLYVDRYEVETGIVHLVHAANAQHVRALNYLAHGLYDPDSWLFMYHRRKQRKERLGAGQAHEARRAGTEAWFEEKEKLREVAEEWQYDPSVPLEVFVGGSAVRIPQPLGTGNTIPAAMHILRALSSMTYRISDLLRAGAAAYNENNEVVALEHFSEAAELGLVSAQENAATILEKMEKDVCESGAYRGDDAGKSLGLDGVPLLTPRGIATKAFTFSSSVACHRYFKNAAMWRWLQLANNNDVGAKKVLAKYAIVGSNLHGYGTPNNTEASLLLAYAAEMGDVESLLNLGWLYWDRDFPHYSKATTDVLFASAWEWETSQGEAKHMLDRDGILYTGTLGLAPFLAQAWLYFYPWYSKSFLFSVLPELRHAWGIVLRAFYNEGYRFIFNGQEPPLHSFTPYLHPESQQDMLQSLRRPDQKVAGRHPFLQDFNFWAEKFSIEKEYKSIRYDRVLIAALLILFVLLKIVKILVMNSI